MYPSRSTFRSGEPHSLWWYTKNDDRSAPPDRQWVLGVSNGYAMLRGLLIMLRLRIDMLGTSALTIGNRIMSPDEIDITGRSGWNETVLKALWAVVAHDHPDPTVLDAIEQDINARRVSATSARAALWFAFYSTSTSSSGGISFETVGSDTTMRELESRSSIEWGRGGPEDILLDADAILPAFGWPMPYEGVNVRDGELPVMGTPWPGATIAYELSQRSHSPGPNPLFLFGGLVLFFGGLYASEP